MSSRSHNQLSAWTIPFTQHRDELHCAKALSSALKLNAAVERVVQQGANHFPTYTVTFTHDEIQQTVDANAVALCTPAYAAANIIRPIDPELAGKIESICCLPAMMEF